MLPCSEKAKIKVQSALKARVSCLLTRFGVSLQGDASPHESWQAHEAEIWSCSFDRWQVPLKLIPDRLQSF